MRIARRELLALLAGMACAPARRREVGSPRVLRSGPERTRIAYDDPRANDKHVLFERINRDRTLHGVAPSSTTARGAGGRPVLPGRRAVGLLGALGPAGARALRPLGPFGRRRLPRRERRRLERGLGPARHAGRRDPDPQPRVDDGRERRRRTSHRRTILDPQWTHVGVRIGAVGGQFRMTQEFTRVGFGVDRDPRGAGACRRGGHLRWQAAAGLGSQGSSRCASSRAPRQLTRSGDRAARQLRLSAGHRDRAPSGAVPLPGWSTSGGPSSTTAAAGSPYRFLLDHGPGYYFVLCYLQHAEAGGRR